MLLSLLACAASDPTPFTPVDLLSYVDPFVGSGGDAFGYGGLNPAAQVPNGLAKVGPDTSSESSRIGFQHTAGYDYDDSYVTGFSHYRLPGIGVGDGGALGVMLSDAPMTGDWQQDRRPYSHNDETAEPGYYRLGIQDLGQVEIAAGPKYARHAYQWEGEQRWLKIDLGHTANNEVEIPEGSLTVTSTGAEGWLRLAGSLTRRGGDGGMPIHFALSFSQPPAESILSLDGETAEGDSVDGPGLLNLRFDQDVELAVGLSVVDLESARANLALAQDRSLEQIRSEATADWQAALGAVQVSGGDEELLGIFASAAYHSLSMPTDMTEADGRYRGIDGQVHSAEGFTYHSDFSGWDTYRTLHPWVIWVYPELAVDLAASISAMGQQRGAHPRWPAGTTESGSMVGSPLEIVMAETALKIGPFPGDQQAFELALESAFNPDLPLSTRHSLQAYMDSGYLPADVDGGSVSKTQEMAIADHAIGLWAELQGAPESTELLERAKAFQQVHNIETQQATGRYSDGSWMPPGEEGWPDEFVEGNTWQYTWLAPHDPAGLAEAFGGNAPAVTALQELFELSAAVEDTDFPDPYYWHGNEPDLHASLLFVFWGRPDLTQQWVRWIQDHRYFLDPAGLDGNDDGGTLSAWFCWTALGLYPMNGGTTYALTTPRFDAARVGQLSIASVGSGDYLAGVILDGEPLEQAWITHEQLAEAQDLLFLRSPEPTEWGQ